MEQDGQMQPNIYLSQTEGRPGTAIACFYLEAGNEIYGWRISGKSHRFAAAFFMLENFYAADHGVLYRSVEDDVYGPWMIDSPRQQGEIRSPLPEFVRHELERIQSVFVQEWLFFENDPEAEAEIAAYDRQGLPIQAANIRLRKLSRFYRTANHWEYRTAGFDKNVSEYLQRHMRVTDILTQKWERPGDTRSYIPAQWGVS